MFAGIDTHKDTLAVAVVDETGRQLAAAQLPNTEPGFVQLVGMLAVHRVVRVGIEGSGNFGRAIAVHLMLGWMPEWEVAVVEVPTLMTSRERRAQVGRGKTDPVDALAIARVTARETMLPPVRLTVGPAADLRALLDYRDDLMAERTALVNRVHAELTGLAPGYRAQIRSLTSRARVRAALELLVGEEAIRAELCRRRLERVLDIDAEAAAVKRQIAGLVAESGTRLTQTHGVGPVVAARFLAEVVDITRYPNRDTFASAASTNGTARIPESSVTHGLAQVQPRQEPADEQDAPHDRADPDPRAGHGPRLLPAQARTGKTKPRSEALFQPALSDLVYRPCQITT